LSLRLHRNTQVSSWALRAPWRVLLRRFDEINRGAIRTVACALVDAQ